MLHSTSRQEQALQEMRRKRVHTALALQTLILQCCHATMYWSRAREQPITADALRSCQFSRARRAKTVFRSFIPLL